MMVKLIKPWGLHVAGAVLDLPSSTVEALMMNARKVAVVVDQAEAAKGKSKKKGR